MGADPFTWAAMALAATQAVGEAGAAGERDKAARAKREYAAKVNERNAQLVEKQTRERKDEALAAYRRALSSANVGLTKGGVSTAAGSALEHLGGAAKRQAKELQDLEYEGALKARQARAGSGCAGYGGSGAGYSAARTLLSLGSRAYDSW